MRASPAKATAAEASSDQPFAPSLIPPAPDAEFVRKMLGEAGRFLRPTRSSIRSSEISAVPSSPCGRTIMSVISINE